MELRSNIDLQLTIVVCTRNRSHSLKRMLDSLAVHLSERTSFEVLIIDNGSSDETPVMLKSFSALGGNFRVVTETEVGLSHARNRGLLESRGEFTAYLDDDILLEEDWVERALSAFEELPGDAAMVGGPVVPQWNESRPLWVESKLWPFLSVLDLGDKTRSLSFPEYLVGTNMIFRTEVLRRIGGFCTQIGRKEGSLLSNEELLTQIRLEESGYQIFYLPQLRVRHLIDGDRLSRSWFLKRAYDQGRSDSKLKFQLAGDEAFGLVEAFSLLSKLFHQIRSTVIRIGLARSYFFSLVHLTSLSGELIESLRDCFRRRKSLFQYFLKASSYLRGRIAETGWICHRKIKDQEITFLLGVKDDFDRCTICLQTLRQFYPSSRVIVISDGDDDQRWNSLSQRFGAEVYKEDWLYGVSSGGKMIHRMLEKYFLNPTPYLIKIDTDTRLSRRFDYLPIGRVAFGTRQAEGASLQGGIVGFTRSAAERLYRQNVCLDPILAEPRESWLLTRNPWVRRSLSYRAYQQNLIGFEWVLAWCLKRCFIPMINFSECHSQWKETPVNLNRKFAMTHPHKYFA